MSSPQTFNYHYHRLRHELGNYAALRLANSDGAIVSMHQSGTHWLKYMLASAMALHYNVAGPRYNHANDIIGGLKDIPVYPVLPRIVSTHSVAPLVLKLPYLVELFKLPPIVLLVRDLRVSLISNFRKWQTRYAMPFSEFLQGDPSGRRFNSDIWWCLRFQNAWGALAARYPQRIQLIRYEDLRAAPLHGLTQAAAHVGLELSAAELEHGVAAATKPAMAARADPSRPPGEVNQYDNAEPFAHYSDRDRRFIERCCERYLGYDFAYDYTRWS